MADSQFFTNKGPLSLQQLAEIGQARVHEPLPDKVSVETLFKDVAPLNTAQRDHVSVLHNKKYNQDLKTTQAGVCIIHPDQLELSSKQGALLLTETPYRAYAQIATAFYPQADDMGYAALQSEPIHKTAKIGKGCQFEPGVVIGSQAEIDDDVTIAANTVIGRGVKIGKGCRIGAGVTISFSLIGSHVVIHSGVRIGQAGFGFFMDKLGHVTVPQLGRVIIGDAADIGANTTIDRGSGPDTIIGAGSRIDNLVQIAHNVCLGRGCVIVALVGISGSAKIGDYSVIAGQVGVAGHITIGKGVQIAAQSGVIHDIEDGAIVGGRPAIPSKQWIRQMIALKHLAAGKGKMNHGS